MKKMQIHQFDPVIYPVKLYVVKYPDENEINDKFYSIDELPINYKLSTAAEATTCKNIIRLKETNKYGVLITIYPGPISVGVIAHEATHAARVIWSWLTEDETGAEADAYLVGWISDCINQVKTNKFKNN
jgi:hypothetical protein